MYFVYNRWVNSLQTARVTRWGGMISTPDAVLQAVIKRALIDSGSPPHIVNELMENAHERRWPNGLSTLETRQLNRRQYENYVTKRIPGVFDVHFIILLCNLLRKGYGIATVCVCECMYLYVPIISFLAKFKENPLINVH